MIKINKPKYFRKNQSVKTIDIQGKKEEAELQKTSLDESKKAFADLQNLLHHVPAVPCKKDYTTH